MSKSSVEVKAELNRRANVMKGKIACHLSVGRDRHAPLVWYAIVAEDCSMKDLRKAIALTGKVCVYEGKRSRENFFRQREISAASMRRRHSLCRQWRTRTNLSL
jgi:hypothetical protein